MIISKIKYNFEFMLKYLFKFINLKYITILSLILRKVLINTSKESFTIGEDFLNFKQH